MNGLSLTTFHGSRYSQENLPRLIARHTVSRFKFGSKAVTFDPPVEFVVWEVSNRYSSGFKADSEDVRLCRGWCAVEVGPHNLSKTPSAAKMAFERWLLSREHGRDTEGCISETLSTGADEKGEKRISESLKLKIPEWHYDYVLHERVQLMVWGDLPDMIVAEPSKLHIYEIKSDLDSVSRLKRQIISYLGSAHSLTIVCGSKMLPKVEKHLLKLDEDPEMPCKMEEVGLAVWDGEVRLLRKATVIQPHRSAFLLSLRRSDISALGLVKRYGLRGGKWAMLEQLCEQISDEEANRIVCRRIREFK